MLDSPVTERMTAQEASPLSNPVAVMEAARLARQYASDYITDPELRKNVELLADVADRALADLERCGIASISHLDPDDQTAFDSSTAADASEHLRSRLDTVKVRLARCLSDLGGEPAGDLGHLAEALERMVAETIADRRSAATGILSVEMVDLECLRRQVVERLVSYIHYTRARIDRQMRRGGGQVDVERFFTDFLSGLLPAAREVGAFAPSEEDLADLRSLVWDHHKLDITSDVGGERQSVDHSLKERFWRLWERLLASYGEERT